MTCALIPGGNGQPSASCVPWPWGRRKPQECPTQHCCCSKTAPIAEHPAQHCCSSKAQHPQWGGWHRTAGCTHLTALCCPAAMQGLQTVLCVAMKIHRQLLQYKVMCMSSPTHHRARMGPASENITTELLITAYSYYYFALLRKICAFSSFVHSNLMTSNT